MITPYFGKEVITADGIEVRVNPDDKARALALVETTKAISGISDELTFTAARNAAAQLKAKLDEIKSQQKQAKLPFDAVSTAIDNLAKGIAAPVDAEHKRVLNLLNTYVAKLDADRKAEEKRKADEVRRQQAEADRKVREAHALLAETQAFLRKAQDEAQRSLLRAESKERENKLLREQLEQELAGDAAELEMMTEPPRQSLVPGGRVAYKYDFKLIDVQKTCEARCYRLLRWELDIPACQDSVKSQLEGLPEIEPTLPGIQITKRINVSVKAAAKVELQDNFHPRDPNVL